MPGIADDKWRVKSPIVAASSYDVKTSASIEDGFSGHFALKSAIYVSISRTPFT